jgi:hypothetical protein
VAVRERSSTESKNEETSLQDFQLRDFSVEAVVEGSWRYLKEEIASRLINVISF